MSYMIHELIRPLHHITLFIFTFLKINNLGNKWHKDSRCQIQQTCQYLQMCYCLLLMLEGSVKTFLAFGALKPQTEVFPALFSLFFTLMSFLNTICLFSLAKEWIFTLRFMSASLILDCDLISAEAWRSRTVTVLIKYSDPFVYVCSETLME